LVPCAYRRVDNRLHPHCSVLHCQSTPDALDHSACTKTLCKVEKVENDSYDTKHVPGCEKCDWVDADAEQSVRILKDGRSYPQIDPYGPLKPSGALYFQAYESEIKTPYVAIVHVWSDGLGNPHKNSIPHCQFLQLSRHVASIPPEPSQQKLSSFWLDTICCPVKDDSEPQNTAIAKMKDTYEKASAVLVLDASLLPQAAGELEDTEILLGLSAANGPLVYGLTRRVHWRDDCIFSSPTGHIT
jgi:hypothetical protein